MPTGEAPLNIDLPNKVRGDTLEFQFKPITYEGSNLPVGTTTIMTARARGGDTVAWSTAGVLSGDQLDFTIDPTANTTAKLLDYDVQATWPTTEVRTLIRGTIQILQDATL